jgi:hypothetical protein
VCGWVVGAAMNRELRTYTLTVVVEPDDEMWHAYCQTP